MLLLTLIIPLVHLQVDALVEESIRHSPYFVTVRRNDAKDLWAGAIVSPTHVLTSFYCVVRKNSTKDPELFVHAGTLTNDFGKGTIHGVKRIILYNKANATNLQIHNLALLQLNKPMRFDEFHQPIGLTSRKPRSPVMGSYVDVKSRRIVTVPILKSQDCDWAYGEAVVRKFEFCAGYVRDGVARSCVTDGNGPLVVNGQLAGIFSHNLVCYTDLHLSVFTNLVSYTKWIRSHAGID